MKNYKIAFLGLGLMGFRQATRLLQAGFEVTVWNRSLEKAQALKSIGAIVADEAAFSVKDADIIFTMLENGDIVNDVLFKRGVADAMRPGALLVDMSSIRPSQAQQNATRLAQRSIGCLDAPVSGGTVGAETGKLAIMVGGPEQEFALAEGLLAAMGNAVHEGHTARVNSPSLPTRSSSALQSLPSQKHSIW
jgi:3-hydroxyisobutyrate dehydrogenase-like beta-hydroxyacid dehydrogenase